MLIFKQITITRLVFTDLCLQIDIALGNVCLLYGFDQFVAKAVILNNITTKYLVINIGFI